MQEGVNSFRFVDSEDENECEGISSDTHDVAPTKLDVYGRQWHDIAVPSRRGASRIDGFMAEREAVTTSPSRELAEADSEHGMSGGAEQEPACRPDGASPPPSPPCWPMRASVTVAAVPLCWPVWWLGPAPLGPVAPAREALAEEEMVLEQAHAGESRVTASQARRHRRSRTRRQLLEADSAISSPAWPGKSFRRQEVQTVNTFIHFPETNEEDGQSEGPCRRAASAPVEARAGGVASGATCGAAALGAEPEFERVEDDLSDDAQEPNFAGNAGRPHAAAEVFAKLPAAGSILWKAGSARPGTIVFGERAVGEVLTRRPGTTPVEGGAGAKAGFLCFKGNVELEKEDATGAEGDAELESEGGTGKDGHSLFGDRVAEVMKRPRAQGTIPGGRYEPFADFARTLAMGIKASDVSPRRTLAARPRDSSFAEPQLRASLAAAAVTADGGGGGRSGDSGEARRDASDPTSDAIASAAVSDGAEAGGQEAESGIERAVEEPASSPRRDGNSGATMGETDSEGAIGVDLLTNLPEDCGADCGSMTLETEGGDRSGGISVITAAPYEAPADVDDERQAGEKEARADTNAPASMPGDAAAGGPALVPRSLLGEDGGEKCGSCQPREAAGIIVQEEAAVGSADNAELAAATERPTTDDDAAARAPVCECEVLDTSIGDDAMQLSGCGGSGSSSLAERSCAPALRDASQPPRVRGGGTNSAERRPTAKDARLEQHDSLDASIAAAKRFIEGSEKAQDRLLRTYESSQIGLQELYGLLDEAQRFRRVAVSSAQRRKAAVFVADRRRDVAASEQAMKDIMRDVGKVSERINEVRLELTRMQADKRRGLRRKGGGAAQAYGDVHHRCGKG